MTEPIDETARPFLRWAGGKTRSIPFLQDHLPPDFTPKSMYYEPFLGAGALFFYLEPARAALSDSNSGLIECYKAIQQDPELLSKYLREHKSRTSKEYYYRMRQVYNKAEPSLAKAALFIYLNKACFNGIWRVNKRGDFNVPYGFKEPPALPSREELRRVSAALSRTVLTQRDYKDAVRSARKGDFVYFDPPYPPLNGTSEYTHYTRERFTKEDHKKLAQVAKGLSKRGCRVLISNSDTAFIRSLYKDYFNIYELEVTRWIRTDGVRYKVKELAITNYDIESKG